MTEFETKSHHPAGLRLTLFNSTKVYLLCKLHDIFFPQKSKFLAYFFSYCIKRCEHCFVLFYLDLSVVRGVRDDALTPSESCGRQTQGGTR